MARVLVFFQYYCTPRGAYATRYYEFSRRWVKAGHDVTIITSIYDKSDLEPTGFVSRYTIEGARIIAMNLKLSNKHGMLRRIWTFVLYSLLSCWYALTLPADVVVTSSGPISVGVPGLLAHWLRGKPLIFEVRDLWPEGAIQLGLLRSGVARAFARWFERLCYRGAAVVVALSPGMARGVTAAAPGTQVEIIPNAADLDLFDPGATPPAAIAAETAGRFVALYAGTLGRANSGGEIVDLAAELKRRGAHDVDIVVIGDGYELAEMQRRAAAEGLDHLKLIGIRSKIETAGWLAASRVTLCLFKPYPVLATNSPNKLFDSLAAGRPVLNNTDGWIKDMLAEGDCGATYTAGDVRRAADLLIAMRDDPERLRAMGARARTLAEQRFSRDLLARQYGDLIARIAHG
ncbi:MAG: glycosyltransferase family 4 protein [Candidatus Eisenbacteria bacterium]|nr:glycosyltransferase family 4 protein [Candidatus Eisenbacteria bacterium]